MMSIIFLILLSKVKLNAQWKSVYYGNKIYLRLCYVTGTEQVPKIINKKRFNSAAISTYKDQYLKKWRVKNR